MTQAPDVHGTTRQRLDPEEQWVDAALRPQPTPWHALPDDQYQAEFQSLSRWNDWLGATFGTLGLPACWPQHDNFVQYVGAIRDAWRFAYHPSGDANLPLTWITELDSHTALLRSWAMRLDCSHQDHSADAT